VVICLQRDADLHMAQLIPLPLTVSCFSKIQIGFTFVVPAHPGSLVRRAVKRVCVCVCVCVCVVCYSPCTTTIVTQKRYREIFVTVPANFECFEHREPYSNTYLLFEYSVAALARGLASARRSCVSPARKQLADRQVSNALEGTIH